MEQSIDDLVRRARRGDFEGMSFGGLVRMSVTQGETAQSEEALANVEANLMKWRPSNGQEIKNLNVQESDIRRVVEAGGGHYVHTYEEPNTSAWHQRVVILPDGTPEWRVIRPVYEGALQDLRRGYAPNGMVMHGLFCYDIDRLTRDMRHLEDAISAVSRYGRPILDYSGTLDLLTDNGRTVARIVVATKSQQSADTARRVARKHAELQANGVRTNGSRSFGWNEDRVTLDPAEVRAIKAARRWLKQGVSRRQCVARWTKAGIRSIKGNPFTDHTFCYLMRNPRLCGYRMRTVSTINPETAQTTTKTVIVYDEDGNPVLGQWERIFTPEEHQEIMEIIGEQQPGFNARKYEGSGTLRCPKCHTKMTGKKSPPAHKQPPGHHYYTCPKCFGVRIDGPKTDKAIKAIVISIFEEENAARSIQAEEGPRQWEREDELTKVQQAIRDLEAAEGTISAQRFYSRLAKFEADEKKLRAEKAEFTRAVQGTIGKAVNLRRDWDSLDFIARRVYIENALTAIKVKSVGNGNWHQPVMDRLEPVKRNA